MSNSTVDPVVLPDVHDPTVPIDQLIPLIPANKPVDNPAEEQPAPSPDTGKAQPQKLPQTEPLDPEKDADFGGGD